MAVGDWGVWHACRKCHYIEEFGLLKNCCAKCGTLFLLGLNQVPKIARLKLDPPSDVSPEWALELKKYDPKIWCEYPVRKETAHDYKNSNT